MCITSSKIPEPICDLNAQLQALIDPKAFRKAMIVTERRDSLVHQPGLLYSQHADGSMLIINPDKMTDNAALTAQMAHTVFEKHGLSNESAIATILGYTVSKSALPPNTPIAVVQAHNEDGYVVWEQVTDRKHIDETCRRAELFTSHEITINHPCDVLIRRLRLLKEEESWK